MVANYSSGKRKYDSYPTEAKAIEAANLLARRLSTKQVVAANMTNSEAASYAAAVETLKPHDVYIFAGCGRNSLRVHQVGRKPAYSP